MLVKFLKLKCLYISDPMRRFKKYIPDDKTIKEHKYLSIFGRMLHEPSLWHLNRRSTAGAFLNGLFWAAIPMPFQMVAAAATAIPSRVNLPVSVALVWITNPLTMPPIFYFNYLVGNWLMGHDAHVNDFEPSIEWFKESMEHIWQPLYLGSVFVGIVAGLLGYVSIRLLWRLHLIKHLKRRKHLRNRRQNAG